MHPQLKLFARQYLGVVVATLIPVLLTAFLSMPIALARHPGETPVAGAATNGHMT
jgi:hypothetical protein